MQKLSEIKLALILNYPWWQLILADLMFANLFSINSLFPQKLILTLIYINVNIFTFLHANDFLQCKYEKMLEF